MMKENERDFRMDEWLKQGAQGMKSKRRTMMRSIVPASFSGHLRAARRETLLAFRSLIDEAIERLEPDTTPRATNIKVD